MTSEQDNRPLVNRVTDTKYKVTDFKLMDL